MSPTLKPCPFCGGEAELDYDTHDPVGWCVGCRGCDYSLSFRPKDDAVTAWNTRAPEREAKAEPVAWLLRFGENGQYRSVSIVHPGATYADQELTPLYASPPATEKP